jgi:hypothetical protein
LFVGWLIGFFLQADTYGLCVIAHMMLHGTQMSIQKTPRPDGSYMYQPTSPFKRCFDAIAYTPL